MKVYTTAQLTKLLAREIAVLNLRAEQENRKGLGNAAKNLYNFGQKIIGMDNTLNPVETIALMRVLKCED